VTLIDSATRGHEAVAAAVVAGVLELDDERVRFAHPLLGSVAYAQLPPARKRELHARLTMILDDPEERGRHLALAAEQADAEVASALDEAARRARARGAPDAAAELWEQARQLSPADARQQARQRGIEAAERHFEAGDGERARALLEEIVAESPPGRDRAHALARLGWVRAHQTASGPEPTSSAPHWPSMLALGSVQRRDRKKRAARESLGGALEVFDKLGATVWASRTRAELARVGGRAPAAGLTPTEKRIAELIAAGHTYREAADALFISPKTVQWNLSKIYRKLGVRSRAELAARLSPERSALGDDGDSDLAERPVPG